MNYLDVAIPPFHGPSQCFLPGIDPASAPEPPNSRSDSCWGRGRHSEYDQGSRHGQIRDRIALEQVRNRIVEFFSMLFWTLCGSNASRQAHHLSGIRPDSFTSTHEGFQYEQDPDAVGAFAGLWHRLGC